MEKVVYRLTKEEGVSGESFRDMLIHELSPAIDNLVEGIMIYVIDEAVALTSTDRLGEEAASALPGAPGADGMISIWLRSVSITNQIEPIIENFTKSFDGYLVTESEPLPNVRLDVASIRRTTGFDQVCFLQKPVTQDYSDWLYNWQGLHTQVAIDTQSTCRYTQNLVVRSLTEGALDLHGIVEEGWPDQTAMYDPFVFYNAIGDEEKMHRNSQLMMESCSRFIDFEGEPCDLIGMSQYIVKNRVN
mgnify:CR=1 FL=1